ncbi:MAG: hypothetical protein ACOX7H_07275 [Bacillota bacterium]|jgi:hypothetical protein
MIINPNFFLAMSCPFCQDRMLFRRISPFSFNSNKEYEITCACGAKTLSFKTSGKKHLYVNIFCPACLEEHAYIYNTEELRKKQPLIPSCNETGINLAFIGMRKPIIEKLNHEGDIIIEYQDELSGFFSHPVLMAKLLHRFNTMMSEDRIACSCGSPDFNLQVRADKLLLSCSNCNCSATILASRPSDLQLLKRAEYIVLDPQGPKINFNRGFKILTHEK